MNDTQTLKRNPGTIAWGAFFIWWGITEIFSSLPNGTGAVGIGLILLGLNAARALNNIPASKFTTILGFLALVLGGLEMAQPLLRLPFELPVFAIVLIVFGAYMLIQETVWSKANA